MSAELIVAIKAQAQQFKQTLGDMGDEVKTFSKQSGGAMQTVQQNWGKISLAAAGAGAALEGLARSQADNTQAARRLAAATNLTEKDIRGMAAEMTNATIPFSSAIGLMEQARNQGLQTGEELQRFTQFWDMVGDATGLAADRLAESGVALRAVGIAAGEEEQALAAFGFITQETSGDVSEFLMFIERMGPELRELGGDVNDAAAIMGALEQELGMTARTARQEFRRAVNEADGDMNQVIETLGLSQEQFALYSQKVAESGDVIGRNAEIHAESRTFLQEFQAQIGALVGEHGALIGQVANLAPVLIAVGPAVKGVGVAMTAATGIVKGLSAAMLLLAANPVGLVIAGITALVAIGWTLHKNWDEVTRLATEAWEFVRRSVEVVSQRIKRIVSDLARGVLGSINEMVSGVRDRVSGMVDSVTGFFGNMYDTVVGNSIVPDMRRDVLSEFGMMQNQSVGIMADMNQQTVRQMDMMQTGVVNTTRGMSQGLMSVADDLTGGWLGKIDGIVSQTVSLFGGMGGGISGVLDNIFGALGIGGGGGSVGSSLGQKAGEFLGGLLPFGSIGKKVGGFLGKTIGKILPFADGGIVTQPTLGLIGEGGQSEAVIPLNRLESMMNPQPMVVQLQLSGRTVEEIFIRGRQRAGQRGRD